MYVMSLGLPNLHRGHYPPQMRILRSATSLKFMKGQMESFSRYANFLILFISGESSFNLRDLTK